jgi:hypothetical protein
MALTLLPVRMIRRPGHASVEAILSVAVESLDARGRAPRPCAGWLGVVDWISAFWCGSGWRCVHVVIWLVLSRR